MQKNVIKRPKEIMLEVTKLRMFELTTKITKYLKDEFGLASTIQTHQPKEFIDIYLTNYTHHDDIETELPDDKIAKAILKMFNEVHKLEGVNAVNVWPTEFGYTIVLEQHEDEEVLKENSYLHYYYYNENLLDDNIEVNKNMRTSLTEAKEDEEEALRRITKQKIEEPTKPKEKDVVDEPELSDDDSGVELDRDLDLEVDEVKNVRDAEELEQDLSNTVLDNRFIWFFMVMDAYANELTTELDNLDEAIDVIVENGNASLLVAYPYIDPNPEDELVDLVFADNPGPIIIYDREDE